MRNLVGLPGFDLAWADLDATWTPGRETGRFGLQVDSTIWLPFARFSFLLSPLFAETCRSRVKAESSKRLQWQTISAGPADECVTCRHDVTEARVAVVRQSIEPGPSVLRHSEAFSTTTSSFIC